jgi:hypothetical protein
MVFHKILDCSSGSLCTSLSKSCNIYVHPILEFTVSTTLGPLCESLFFFKHLQFTLFLHLGPQYTIVRNNSKDFRFINHNLHCKVYILRLRRSEETHGKIAAQWLQLHRGSDCVQNSAVNALPQPAQPAVCVSVSRLN